MADEEAKDEKEGEAGATPDGAAEVKPSKMKKLLLFGGIPVLLVLLVGTPIVIMTMGNEKPEVPQAEKDMAQQENGLVAEGFEDEELYEEDEEPLGALYPMQTFVVNLSDGGYLRCQLQIEFTERDVPRRFYAKLAPIRDGLINILANQKREDLSIEKGRGILKREVQDFINESLRKEQVKSIYFTQFVVQ